KRNGPRNCSAPGSCYLVPSCSAVNSALAALPRLLGLLEAGLLQQRRAKHVLFLGEDIFEFGPRRELVVDHVLVIGDADLVARAEGRAEGPLAVYLPPVGAAHVAEVPDAVLERQLGVRPGHVLKV